MEVSYKDTLKATLADRPYLSVMIALIIVALIATLYVVFSVESRDIQVTTRYSSFGEANYYKGRWFSLYGFGILFLAIAGAHSVLMLKFRALEHRSFGLLFGGLSILIILIGLVYVSNIIQQLAFI